jgi:hypothetical protein
MGQMVEWDVSQRAEWGRGWNGAWGRIGQRVEWGTGKNRAEGGQNGWNRAKQGAGQNRQRVECGTGKNRRGQNKAEGGMGCQVHSPVHDMDFDLLCIHTYLHVVMYKVSNSLGAEQVQNGGWGAEWSVG